MSFSNPYAIVLRPMSAIAVVVDILSFIPGLKPNQTDARFVRFYYADERSPTGDAVYLDIDGAAAAEEYVKLTERKDQGPWLLTFVKGQGYKDFGSDLKPSARNT